MEKWESGNQRSVCESLKSPGDVQLASSKLQGLGVRPVTAPEWAALKPENDGEGMLRARQVADEGQTEGYTEVVRHLGL